MAASAQSSFTEQLQQSKAGEGKVTVTQDKAITDLVNGSKQTATPQPAPKPVAKPTVQQPKTQPTEDKPSAQKAPAEEKLPVVAERQEATPDTTYTEDTRKKIMKGYKVSGYRVQVYAGGNSRDARQKAEKTGREINSLFPGEPVYVHFYSPRWICRMGNYRTYEEAHQVLNAVKKLGYNSAIIVKGKITVPYQPK
ncbi:MAG: SPOR domain-containing protein [Prevotella sp.]|nr:SPOR domain-containing protein [Prevotella sp.]